MSYAKKYVERLIGEARIEVNGNNPWDIRVNDERFYSEVFLKGSLGLGESYIDRDWDCESLDEFICRILRSGIREKAKTPGVIFHSLKDRVLNSLFNLQTKRRSKKVAEVHYDLGNDFYLAMLGETMQYTCAYWKDADNIDEAQRNKMRLVCEKLKLKPEERVVELGSGWGSFAKFMAENYGVEVVTYNISKEQVDYARSISEGLPITVVHDDYRNARGEFDKVVSIGLCEHVGPKNYRMFFKLARNLLKSDDGLFLLHTIGKNIPTKTTDPFISKYIFPGGFIPSLDQLVQASQGLFVLEDLHNFGADYDRTLMAWNRNFQQNWEFFEDRYGDRFKRMWEYYLLSCAGAFRARELQLWQFVFSKKGVKGGYKSVR